MAFAGGYVLVGGRTDSSATVSCVQRATLKKEERHFGLIDSIVVIVYFVAMIWIGVRFAGRQEGTNDFFLAGQRIPWWAEGLSLMATQVSAIGFMAIPAKSYATNWVYFTGVLTWFIVVPIVTRAFIPFFRQLKVTSAYEYLERRFNLAARIFAVLAFSLLSLGRMAVVLFLPSLALASITGLDLRLCIVAMGVVSTICTVAGGMEAVIWTEVIQAFVLLSGGLICFLWAIGSVDGGVGYFLQATGDYNKLHMADWNWDFTTAAVSVVLIGNVFNRLAALISDQSLVQRYLSTPTQRQAVKALWTDVWVSIPWAILVFGLGTALFVFYRQNPQDLAPSIDADGIVPLFIAQQLPVGISGLVIAAIFAAAMSTLDSSMHSVSTIWMVDVIQRFKPTSERQQLWLARVLVVFLGVFSTAAALWMTMTNVRSLWDFSMQVIGLFIGGLAGLFILGMFFRRANGPGAVVGVIGSCTATCYVQFATKTVWAVVDHQGTFAAAVPEPTSLGLLALAAGACLVRRRA